MSEAENQGKQDGQTSSESGKGCIGAVVLIAIIGWIGYHLLTSAPSPLGVSPDSLVQGIIGLDERLMQYDADKGEFYTDYMGRFSVDIKATARDAPSEYIEIELPDDPNATDIGAAFVMSVFNRIPRDSSHREKAGTFIRDDWGKLFTVERFGKTRVTMERFEGRAVLIKISGD